MGLAVLGLALIASLSLAGIAAASGPGIGIVQEGGGKFKGTISGGSLQISEGPGEGWECKSSAGNAEFSSSTSGTGNLTFSGCVRNGETCQTPGQLAGVIKTTQLSMSPVYVNGTYTVFGLRLKTPASHVFAEYQCSVLNIPSSLTGIGVIPQITSPAINTWSKSVAASLAGGSEEGHQQYEYDLTYLGGPYHLVRNSGEVSKRVVLTTNWTLNFEKNVKFE